MVAQDPFIITSEHRQNMEVAQKRPNTPFLADGRDPGPLPTMAGALPHLSSFWIRCIIIQPLEQQPLHTNLPDAHGLTLSRHPGELGVLPLL